MENEVRVGWELRKVLDTFSDTEIAIAVSFGRSLEDVYKPYLASTRVLQDVMKAAAAKVLKDRHGSSHEFWLSVLENLDSLGSEPWTTNPVQVPTTPHQMSSQPSYQNSNIPLAPPKPTNRVKNNKPHIQPVPLLTRFAFIASSGTREGLREA